MTRQPPSPPPPWGPHTVPNCRLTRIAVALRLAAVLLVLDVLGGGHHAVAVSAVTHLGDRQAGRQAHTATCECDNGGHQVGYATASACRVEGGEMGMTGTCCAGNAVCGMLPAHVPAFCMQSPACACAPGCCMQAQVLPMCCPHGGAVLHVRCQTPATRCSNPGAGHVSAPKVPYLALRVPLVAITALVLLADRGVDAVLSTVPAAAAGRVLGGL